MLEEVAPNVADVVNTCGFDQIYFDASTASRSTAVLLLCRETRPGDDQRFNR